MIKRRLFGLALSVGSIALLAASGRLLCDVSMLEQAPIAQESRRLREVIYQDEQLLRQVDYSLSHDILSPEEWVLKTAQADSVRGVLERKRQDYDAFRSQPEFKEHLAELDDLFNHKFVYGFFLLLPALALGYASSIKLKGQTFREYFQDRMGRQLQKEARKRLD